LIGHLGTLALDLSDAVDVPIHRHLAGADDGLEPEQLPLGVPTRLRVPHGELPNGETRTVLKLKPELAPVKVAVSPLLKNKPELVEKAREVYTMLKKEIGNVAWDDNGNIGKRYRRQDEIGTPYCVVIDFETLEGKEGPVGTVTVRDRDTTEQKRVPISDLLNKIA